MHYLAKIACLTAQLSLLAIPAQAEETSLITQDTIKGVYEIVHSPVLGQVFIAASPSLAEGSTGVVHVLDDTNLQPVREIPLDHQAFGLALDHTTGRLYVGHTMEGSISVLDTGSGQLVAEIQLGQADAEGNVEHTRMIAIDETRGRAFVTSPTGDGAAWLVDLTTNRLLRRIDDAGIWAAGAAYDPASGLFYSSGGGIEEISVFSAETGDRVTGFSTGDTTLSGKENSKHFFVNLAIDLSGKRLFATDASTQMLYVFDIESGQVAHKLSIGLGILDVAFNTYRQEIYITHRGATRDAPHGHGGLTIIDATDYSVRAHLDLGTHPNSLAVSQDGALLFVTVKAPYDKTHPEFTDSELDKVVRINLPTFTPD